MPPKFYGQHKEDAILWGLFHTLKTGVFVDVGALDGIEYSNSYLFELANWKGVCIEAHPKYAAICKKNRPKSIVVHAAAADEDKAEVPFYTTSFGSFSSIDKNMEPYFKGTYSRHFKGYEPEIKVPMVRLDTVFEQNGMRGIDFISIDVEGSEVTVLKGLTLSKYKPRVILAEALDPDKEKELIGYLKPQGYTFCRRCKNNLYFCFNKADADIIGTVKIPK